MPKYYNSSDSVISLGSKRIEPGATVESYAYLPTPLPSGLTMTANAPYFDPVLYSAKLTSNTVYNLAASITGNYRIIIYVGTGDCSIQLNDGAAGQRYLGLYQTWTCDCRDRIINSINFAISSGSVYLTVEKT